MISNLNIKTKMFDFEVCVLIGWLAETVIEPANQVVVQLYRYLHHTHSDLCFLSPVYFTFVIISLTHDTKLH